MTKSILNSSTRSDATAPILDDMKQVRFASSVRVMKIERIQMRYHDDCFYLPDELFDIRQSDTLAIRRAQLYAKQMQAKDGHKYELEETDIFTWRGFEDLRDGTSKQANTKAHRETVLGEWKKLSQQQTSMTAKMEQLRQTSKASSRVHRYAADKRGIADAKVQGHSTTIKSGIRGFKQSLSTSFDGAMKILQVKSTNSNSNSNKQQKQSSVLAYAA